jgi:hypothetical protein
MNDVADFLVSFPRSEFPYLAAAAVVARTGIAWFDLDATAGVRLSARGNELGLVRQLHATASNGASNLPVCGFGIAAAELPSVVRKASKERWTCLDIIVAPQANTATVAQDRIVLTGGFPPELNLFEGLMELDDDQLDATDLTLSLQRPSTLDGLTTGEGDTIIHVGSLRECLAAAAKLIPTDSKQPHYEILEFADGLAHGGSLNLRFCLEAPFLKGIDLRFSRSQVGPLAHLLASFDPLSSHHLTVSRRHYIFTDSHTKLYATIPTQRHPQPPTAVLSNRPNTEAQVESGRFDRAEEH